MVGERKLRIGEKMVQNDGEKVVAEIKKLKRTHGYWSLCIAEQKRNVSVVFVA